MTSNCCRPWEGGRIFDFWCEVKRGNTLIRTGIAAPAGIIIDQFPDDFADDKAIRMIPVLVFPCDFDNDAVQMFSFVLANDDINWRYGFCRHDPETDSAMVLITDLPWHDTFFKMLGILADVRRRSVEDFDAFLVDTYTSPVPPPGSCMKLPYNQGRRTFTFESPPINRLASVPEDYNLTVYNSVASPDVMIAVFAAMLHERRIIFTSRVINKHSACVQAAHNLLRPMVWKHVYMPLLPMKLKDYLTSPMPYLIGAPYMVLETLCLAEIGDAVIFNCDTKKIETPFNDVRALPQQITLKLRKDLQMASSSNGNGISMAFLNVWVKLIGRYRDGIEVREKGVNFNREKYLTHSPKPLRPFLKSYMETQMFQNFIDERAKMLKKGEVHWDELEWTSMRYAQKKTNRGFLQRLCAFRKGRPPKTQLGPNCESLHSDMSGALDLSENIVNRLRKLMGSRTYRHIQTQHEIKELYTRLAYTIAIGVSGFQALQTKCTANMQQLGLVEDDKLQKNCIKELVLPPCNPQKTIDNSHLEGMDINTAEIMHSQYCESN